MVQQPAGGTQQAFDWLPAVRVKCLRCDGTFFSRELSPRCPHCGFQETPS